MDGSSIEGYSFFSFLIYSLPNSIHKEIPKSLGYLNFEQVNQPVHLSLSISCIMPDISHMSQNPFTKKLHLLIFFEEPF